MSKTYEIEPFYDERTSTLSYVVYDGASKDAVVIDSVLDYDPAASSVSYESVNRVTAFLRDKELTLRYVLETHPHADHLSGSQVLKSRFPGAEIGIGSEITVVQKTFKEVFDLPADFATDGSQFDRLFAAGENVTSGTLEFEVISTPGHTPACVTYKFGDAIFTGDVLFMPDMGTGRCDFPAGSASDLYDSILGLYELPDETRVFVGHDYQPGGRDLEFESSIAAQKATNIQLPASRSREEFLEFRTKRDAGLNAPRLLLQSVQVNVDAGALPSANEKGQRYLRIPINAFRPEQDAPIESEEI
jgi:glyoxylase-like metal-dependent hydrolase (beta-lactamase superfamily II)